MILGRIVSNALHVNNLRTELSEAVTHIYRQGWAQGTGGNFSAVLQAEPLVLLMTPSGVNKGTVTPDSLLEINAIGEVISGQGKASAETLLHLTICKNTGATAVLHGHSIYATLLSKRYASQGYISFSGYEMLKGLTGIDTHETEVKVPILPNDQDMVRLSKQAESLLQEPYPVPGLLLAGHGLYAWGKSLFEARRHLEILEFFFELTYRELALGED